jgi:hypothetical protein
MSRYRLEVVKIGDEAVEELQTMDQVIGIEEDLDKFGEFVAAKMLDVEFAVDCALESDTFVDVLEGLADDVIEEEVEECWSRTHAVVDAECLRCLAIPVGLDGGARLEWNSWRRCWSLPESPDCSRKRRSAQRLTCRRPCEDR